jgi:hypothetical protein
MRAVVPALCSLTEVMLPSLGEQRPIAQPPVVGLLATQWKSQPISKNTPLTQMLSTHSLQISIAALTFEELKSDKHTSNLVSFSFFQGNW